MYSENATTSLTTIPLWLALVIIAVFFFGMITLVFLSFKLNSNAIEMPILNNSKANTKATTKEEGRYKPKKSKKVFEFSKVIYILNLIAVATVVGFSIHITYKSGDLMISDLSVIGIICTAAFAELAVHSVVYSRKAQAENVLKIAQAIKSSRDKDIEREDIELANEIYKSNDN